ncbi:MAG: hypothetical protein LBP25_03975, partial [Tannerellaceae bacterium]|nr:hypothetical protein [Tannerellaceae bacterium]
SGDIFQWQSSPDNVTWTNIAGATSPSYSPGILTANAYFRRGTTSGDCETLYTASTRVTLDPVVTVNSIPDKEYHLNTRVPEIPFTSPAGGNITLTYKWTNSNTDIGLPASGEGNLPEFEATGIGRAKITVTPYYNNNCSGTPAEFFLTIYYLVPVNPHLRSRVVGN